MSCGPDTGPGVCVRTAWNLWRPTVGSPDMPSRAKHQKPSQSCLGTGIPAEGPGGLAFARVDASPQKGVWLWKFCCHLGCSSAETLVLGSDVLSESLQGPLPTSDLPTSALSMGPVVPATAHAVLWPNASPLPWSTRPLLSLLFNSVSPLLEHQCGQVVLPPRGREEGASGTTLQRIPMVATG